VGGQSYHLAKRDSFMLWLQLDDEEENRIGHSPVYRFVHPDGVKRLSIPTGNGRGGHAPSR
jgi:hypothetical protein